MNTCTHAMDLAESSACVQVFMTESVQGHCHAVDSKSAASPVTITLKQMAAELAESHDLSMKEAEAVLGDLMTLATRHLKNGDKIRLTGLGILQVQDRPARIDRKSTR